MISSFPFSPRASRLILTALAVVMICGLMWPPGEQGVPGQSAGGEDRMLHTAAIARLHAGDAYYAALGDELRLRKFPTASVFNWRTPVLFSALALNPALGRVAFVMIGIVVLAATVYLLSAQPLPVIIGGAIAQSGAIGVMFDPTLWVFHEVWAGYLVTLSVFAYALRRWTAGSALGLLALFVRELAAPYAVMCALMAWRAARWRELSIWSAGFVAYALHYGWHVRQVAAHQHPGDVAHAEPWLQLGGVPFILTTLRTNSLLHDRPTWLAAVVFVFILAGLLARELPVHMRAAAMVYIACFAVAGQPFNWYWGWLTGFVVPLAFAHGLMMLPKLMSTATGLGDVSGPRHSRPISL